MNKLSFKIEDCSFSLPKNFSNTDLFTVQSSPQNYTIEWNDNNDIFQAINKILTENNRNILLIDKNLYKIYEQKIQIPHEKIFQIDAVEKNKTIYTVLDVIEFLEKQEFSKSETLVVVGGGITQDIGAFVGACYKRGINWVFFPTTLLAMCDSCIGGKTGINHNEAKNQLALFSAPSKIIINPHFLKTLTSQELYSGLGEILKLSIIGGPATFSLYSEHQLPLTNDYSFYKKLILSALHVKKAIIEEDEFEKNIRKSLNYGHTLGHALEILSDYKIPHGQAVAAGIVIANKLACNRKMLNLTLHTEIKKSALSLIERSQIRHLPLLHLESLLKKDKKTMGQSLTLVLIRDIGQTTFLHTPLTADLLEEIAHIIKEEF